MVQVVLSDVSRYHVDKPPGEMGNPWSRFTDVDSNKIFKYTPGAALDAVRGRLTFAEHHFVYSMYGSPCCFVVIGAREAPHDTNLVQGRNKKKEQHFLA
eukprot:scaffold64_cov150-Amphora_coffeaeformis.AAC.11